MATKSVLSNVDLIRKFVFENHPVTTDEIAQAILTEMDSVADLELARTRYVLPVLKANSFYREVAGKWQIEIAEMPEFMALPKVFADEHRLLYDREVRSRVAKQLGKKVATVVLDLNQADGLKQFKNHWGLESWKLCNDEAAEILEQHPSGMNERDLVKQIVERFSLSEDVVILHLKGDAKKRFVLEKKLWYLKEHFKAIKQSADDSAKLPEIKGGDIDSLLEGSFLEAQTLRAEKAQEQDAEGKGRLRKLLKKQAQEVIEQREEQKTEDLAAKLSQVLSAAGVDEYDVQSFQRVEPASKERGLSQKEREEIQAFVDQLLEQETVGVGAPLAAVVNAPLSARKVLDVLRLKYINYTRDRAVIPAEYNRMLVEMLKPAICHQVLHPACFEGSLSGELFSYLFDHTDGAAWALADEDTRLEIVQPDSARYKIGQADATLIEKARDRFMVSQVDLLNHFLNFNYTGIEADKVLSRAARVHSRLNGFENVYIVSRDYLAELPEVFGLPTDPDNDISQRFDRILGNFTFTQDANLAANYLDQSLRLLKANGQLGIFVLQELLTLLKEHALLGEFLADRDVTHFVRLPMIEGRHKVVMLGIRERAPDDEPAQIVSAEVTDFKHANNLVHALESGEGAGTLYELISQQAISTLI